MEYKQLGKSGLHLPALTLGTGTFGGSHGFEGWGNTGVKEATRLVDICLDHGANSFDTADMYSRGEAETILGKAIGGRRDKVILSTKATFAMGPDVNQRGSSRKHLIEACEASLKRLNTDYIDILYMHGFDGNTPVEETLKTLEHLIESGKVRYIGCSNFSGWQLMKSLCVSERYGWSKYIAHQIYYSLLNREAEWELIPAGLDQGVGTVVWSPLSAGRLAGKYRRSEARPSDGRVARGGSPIADTFVSYDRLYDIVDVLEKIAGERGIKVSQVALNWLLQRPSVSSIVIGARTEEQLLENLEAVDWDLTQEEMDQLDSASYAPKIYPYWHQDKHDYLNAQLKF